MRGERFDTVFPAGRAGFVELKDGRFLAIGAHIDELFRMVSPDRGRTWSDGSALRDQAGDAIPGRHVGGVVKLASGGLAVCYEFVYGAGALGETRVLALRRSDDEWGPWTEETPIGLPGDRGMPYHDTMVQTSTGRLLLPVRASFGDRRQRTPAMATVNGREYGVEGHAHYPELDIAYIYYSGDLFVWLDDGYRGAYACDEPTLAEAKDGRLVMFMRSTVGRIVEAWSADGGWSWSSAVPNDLLSSYSPARIRRIPGTGDLQAVWNQVSAEEIRGGSRRSRLSTAISVDNGVTWKCFKTLDCSSALDASPRVAPEQPVSFVIARQHVGEFPNDYSVYHYPNICYASDTVYIIYDRDCVGERTQRKTVVRAFPIEMLYQEEPWDLRLSNEVPPDDGATAIQEAGHVEA